MKLRIFFTWLAVSLVLLGACSFMDTPEGAAREWMQAAVNLDGMKLAERTCAMQQQNVQQGGLMISAISLLGQGLIGQQAKIDISDLKFTTVNKTETTASVRVTGTIRTAILAFSQSQDVDELMQMSYENGKWRYCG
ncbi:MAG TPA: hypothetical protein VFD70_08290 [Anaerolineae bacterium]|nr:hypothetical protein [Anaerolineae bacterium]